MTLPNDKDKIEEYHKKLRGRIPWNKGKKYPHLGNPHSEETKRKIGLALRGRKGHIVSKETREKISQKHRGEKAYNWKGGPNKERERLLKKEWVKKNYDKILFYNERRRARLSLGNHTFGEWENLKKQYGNTCPCCKKTEPEIKLTEDHIIPLSQGGSNFIENIQPLCMPCNSKKHTKIIKFNLEPLDSSSNL